LRTLEKVSAGILQKLDDATAARNKSRKFFTNGLFYEGHLPHAGTPAKNVGEVRAGND
jgi:hypothetical protein